MVLDYKAMVATVDKQSFPRIDPDYDENLFRSILKRVWMRYLQEVVPSVEPFTSTETCAAKALITEEINKTEPQDLAIFIGAGLMGSVETQQKTAKSALYLLFDRVFFAQKDHPHGLPAEYEFADQMIAVAKAIFLQQPLSAEKLDQLGKIMLAQMAKNDPSQPGIFIGRRLAHDLSESLWDLCSDSGLTRLWRLLELMARKPHAGD